MFITTIFVLMEPQSNMRPAVMTLLFLSYWIKLRLKARQELLGVTLAGSLFTRLMHQMSRSGPLWATLWVTSHADSLSNCAEVRNPFAQNINISLGSAS